jgi:hypothetical protein
VGTPTVKIENTTCLAYIGAWQTNIVLNEIFTQYILIDMSKYAKSQKQLGGTHHGPGIITLVK